MHLALYIFYTGYTFYIAIHTHSHRHTYTFTHGSYGTHTYFHSLSSPGLSPRVFHQWFTISSIQTRLLPAGHLQTKSCDAASSGDMLNHSSFRGNTRYPSSSPWGEFSHAAYKGNGFIPFTTFLFPFHTGNVGWEVCPELLRELCGSRTHDPWLDKAQESDTLTTMLCAPKTKRKQHIQIVIV